MNKPSFAKATARPWKYREVESSFEPNNHFEVYAASPHVPGKTQTICDINGPWAHGNYKANAALIVQAVNEYAVLNGCAEELAALEQIFTAWTSDDHNTFASLDDMLTHQMSSVRTMLDTLANLRKQNGTK